MIERDDSSVRQLQRSRSFEGRARTVDPRERVSLPSIHSDEDTELERRRRAELARTLAEARGEVQRAFLASGGGGDVAGSRRLAVAPRRVGSNGAFAGDLLGVPRPSRIDSRVPKLFPEQLLFDHRPPTR